jgi:phage-related baseplate assembly protein
MAIYSLDDLTTPLTRAQVQTKIYDVLATIGVTTTTWKPGGVVRTMIAACAILLAALSVLIAKVARGGFLELAEDAWLALVARYVYGEEKIYATFAEGEITLVNAGGGIYDFDTDEVVFRNPTTGAQYRNSDAIHLPALGTVTVAITAIEAGAASTSAPNTITELVTGMNGVTVANAASVVGQDEEEDPELRARSSEKLGSLSPMGPWDAYTYAAKRALRQDGTLVGVTRARTVKDGAGGVTIYVATASGTVTGTASDIATDLGAVDDAIQRKAAPLAITADTVSATAVSVPVTYSVWMYNTSGLTGAQIEAAILAKLVAFFPAQPVGGNKVGSDPGYVFQDAIRTVIGSALPQIFHVAITEPAADVALTVSQVPVLGTVTPAAVVQVPPSEGSL